MKNTEFSPRSPLELSQAESGSRLSTPVQDTQLHFTTPSPVSWQISSQDYNNYSSNLTQNNLSHPPHPQLSLLRAHNLLNIYLTSILMFLGNVLLLNLDTLWPPLCSIDEMFSLFHCQAGASVNLPTSCLSTVSHNYWDLNLSKNFEHYSLTAKLPIHSD